MATNYCQQGHRRHLVQTYEIYLWSNCNKFVLQYFNHSPPLISDGLYCSLSEVWEHEDAKSIIQCWALKKGASGTILLTSLEKVHVWHCAELNPGPNAQAFYHRWYLNCGTCTLYVWPKSSFMWCMRLEVHFLRSSIWHGGESNHRPLANGVYMLLLSHHWWLLNCGTTTAVLCWWMQLAVPPYQPPSMIRTRTCSWFVLNGFRSKTTLDLK